jgi:hypothetical protein
VSCDRTWRAATGELHHLTAARRCESSPAKRWALDPVAGGNYAKSARQDAQRDRQAPLPFVEESIVHSCGARTRISAWLWTLSRRQSASSGTPHCQRRLSEGSSRVKCRGGTSPTPVVGRKAVPIHPMDLGRMCSIVPDGVGSQNRPDASIRAVPECTWPAVCDRLFRRIREILRQLSIISIDGSSRTKTSGSVLPTLQSCLGCLVINRSSTFGLRPLTTEYRTNHTHKLETRAKSSSARRRRERSGVI